MNEQEKQILRTAAERLLAVADGKTLEWASDGRECLHVGAWGATVIGSEEVRIRPPAAPPEPKPSQEWPPMPTSAQLREWGKVISEDNPRVPEIGDTFMCYCGGSEWDIATATESHDANLATFGGLRWILKDAPKVELPCPPRPTPEQVEKARIPDGRKVRMPTVCEEPNGRAFFCYDAKAVRSPGSYVFPDNVYGHRRWIAEPAEDVVTPWDFKTLPRPFPTLSRWGCDYEIVAANPAIFVTIGGDGRGWNIVRHDWEDMKNFTHNGQPCGEVQS